jgi:nitrite reductase/ring-hydroxylating ferredoxin subunit
VKTGKALTLPATQPVPTFEVRTEGDDILVRTS